MSDIEGNEEIIGQESQLDRELERVAPKEKVKTGPVYKVMSDAKIPVSKQHGKMWKSRRDASKQCREMYEEAWNEAIRYYKGDQMSHRDSAAEDRSGNYSVRRKMNDKWSETENVVFANTTTMLPTLYAKNPQAEFTAPSDVNKPIASFLERLMNKLVGMKYAPGVNLKPKARKAVLNALLTNAGWMKIGWNFKEDSNEAVMAEIMQLAERLQKAKDEKEIREIEGALQALERHMDVVAPAGAYTKFVSPFRIYLDPDTTEPDLSDCKYLFEYDFLPTDYINARYAQKDKNDNWVSQYQPTHVLKTSSSQNAVEDEVANFSLFSKDHDYKEYGYEDRDAFEKAQCTMVWYCWDRTTRRMYMFAENDWTWPIWVWDDPYGLLEFFPYYRLSFYDDPENVWSKGEVTYYLDQQDAINEINDEEARTRLWLKRNIMYDKDSIASEDVEQWLNGPDGTARGIRVPDGKSIQEVIFALSPPGMQQFPEIFNVDRKLAAIDRISSVTDTLRGVQFKTNTTNKAIDTYNSSTQLRVDEKVDLIEDWLGSIIFGLTQLVARFMDPQEAAQLIGVDPALAVQIGNIEPERFRTEFAFRVIGGSTAKPTSKAKKDEAIEVSQVLGQFAQASPVVVEIMLKVLQEAFDEIVIREEDWQRIRDSIAMSQANQGGTGAAGQPEQAGQPDPVKQMLAQVMPQTPPQ